jgi:hypothetical protein
MFYEANPDKKNQKKISRAARLTPSSRNGKRKKLRDAWRTAAGKRNFVPNLCQILRESCHKPGFLASSETRAKGIKKAVNPLCTGFTACF